MKRILLSIICLFTVTLLHAQMDKDSAENEAIARMVTLSEVVVGSNLNVSAFIDRVRKDTTFYKAFKNLRVLSFSSLNNIIMKDKKGKQVATLNSKTHQTYSSGCRTMTKEYENVSGDMLNRKGEYNYFTAELYASLFFTNGKVCGENNIVGNTNLNPKNKSGIEKRKEQLKMLFFNPGKKIPGIPLMGEKSNIFDPRFAKYYDFDIDFVTYYGKDAYRFAIKAKTDLSPSDRDKIVYDKMTTWFDSKSFEILGRDYDLSYNAGAYDFDVHMEVRLTKIGKLLVPTVLHYNGNWNVILQKRERGVFTATLFGFK
ncbi:MAG: hypothetical protein QM727_07720 [Niabella sp.]